MICLKKVLKFDIIPIDEIQDFVKSTIVEGYGRRRYKPEFIRFLSYALASNDETTDHLETLYETGSLTDRPLYDNLHERTDMLGKKLNLFMQSVQINHVSEK